MKIIPTLIISLLFAGHALSDQGDPLPSDRPRNMLDVHLEQMEQMREIQARGETARMRYIVQWVAWTGGSLMIAHRFLRWVTK